MHKSAVSYLKGLYSRGIKPGLERTSKFLSLLGNPEKKLKIIHVAGTNGKGSTAVFISSILKEAGYKTALLTSPHLVKYNERIQINGKQITDADLSKQILKLKKFDSKVKPTYFEFSTVLAYSYSFDKKVDFLVQETGMGGRLDATNTADSLVSVITNISLEHKKYLGNSLQKIAREKAGIIKPKSVFVTTEKNKKLLSLFKKICRSRNTKFNRATPAILKKYGNPKLGLKGMFQQANAAAAVVAAEALGKNYNFKIPKTAVRKGLANARHVGRFEIVRRKPTLVIDCAHNPAGMKALVAALKQEFSRRKINFVFGCSRDKEVGKVIAEMLPLAKSFTVCSAKWKGMPAAKILCAMKELRKSKKFRHLDLNVKVIPDVKKAVKYALKNSGKNDVVCVCGSVFVAGEFL